jgi:ribosomal protein S27E
MDRAQFIQTRFCENCHAPAYCYDRNHGRFLCVKCYEVVASEREPRTAAGSLD